jgi:phosphoribosyl-ATP pyrophosphohydrolase/phosphoribosyl-AMP cyclohydrolase
MDLKFDERGLIPAVVQDAGTKQVLTLAYMNKEALAVSIAEGRTCFYSRSRQALWRKGETSGNVQHIVSITADCDGDALVVEVVKDGPACHTGAESCFFNPVFVSPEVRAFSLPGLYALLEERKKTRPEGSYTTYLFEKGLDKILKKIGEESTEVIIAAKAEDKKETVYEIADLVYHVLVLMVQSGITLGRTPGTNTRGGFCAFCAGFSRMLQGLPRLCRSGRGAFCTPASSFHRRAPV